MSFSTLFHYALRIYYSVVQPIYIWRERGDLLTHVKNTLRSNLRSIEQYKSFSLHYNFLVWLLSR